MPTAANRPCLVSTCTGQLLRGNSCKTGHARSTHAQVNCCMATAAGQAMPGRHMHTSAAAWQPVPTSLSVSACWFVLNKFQSSVGCWNRRVSPAGTTDTIWPPSPPACVAAGNGSIPDSSIQSAYRCQHQGISI
jgi:hypothetical protein